MKKAEDVQGKVPVAIASSRSNDVEVNYDAEDDDDLDSDSRTRDVTVCVEGTLNATEAEEDEEEESDPVDIATQVVLKALLNSRDVFVTVLSTLLISIHERSASAKAASSGEDEDEFDYDSLSCATSSLARRLMRSFCGAEASFQHGQAVTVTLTDFVALNSALETAGANKNAIAQFGI